LTQIGYHFNELFSFDDVYNLKNEVSFISLMKIIQIPFLVPKGFVAVSIWPFLWVRNKKEACSDKILLNHEKIHHQQQKELLMIGFFVWYVLEYLGLYLKYQNSKKAYREISFEKEAYQNEHNFDFLKNRKRWNFMQYT